MADSTQPPTQNGTILFVANDSQNRYGLKDTLEQSGYFVYNRDSFVRGFQLMTVYQLDLIICDGELADVSGLEFCRRLREDPTYNAIPFLLIASDDDFGTAAIQALDTGADDFVRTPIIEGLLFARIRRLMRKQAPRTAVQSTLSGQTTSNELAGILQYLETEMKTGKVEIKSDQGTGLIYLREGRLVNAVAPSGDGLEAIEEILCWPNSHVAFHEGPVSEANVKMDTEITGVLMNCSVAVDEFKEAQGLLPPPTAMFLMKEALPADASPEIIEMAARIPLGDSLEELIMNSPHGERRATLNIIRMIEGGLVQVFDSPYANYQEFCYAQYKHSSFMEPRLLEVRRVLADMPFPLGAPNNFIPTGTSDWLSPAPRILVCGDNHDHVGLFVNSLRAIYAAQTGRKPPERKQLRRSMTLRLDFEDKAIIDIQVLPPKLDDTLLKSLDEYLSDVCGVLLIVSAQDRVTNSENMRTIRQLRQRFRGSFYSAASRVATRDNKYMFKINCVHCGYKLAVNMDESGFTGECPICSNPLTIPDCLDSLIVALQLPEELPVIMVDPTDPQQVRDLVVMQVDSVLHACHPPEDGTITQSGGRSALKGRKDRKKTLQIKVADTRMMSPPPDASAPAPAGADDEEEANGMTTQVVDNAQYVEKSFDPERTVTRPIIIRRPAPRAENLDTREIPSPASAPAAPPALAPSVAQGVPLQMPMAPKLVPKTPASGAPTLKLSPNQSAPPPPPPPPSLTPAPPPTEPEAEDDIQSLLSRIGGNSMDLDDILNSDDEDIDDFINKIKR